ncbi:hypothetical protein CXG81DRAFT_19909 [Caulochytrium protostelioides]|uniref:Uncharacterized protein n=1 Tax=Caulochytrium protostelioides TaxID=1555241 RepID=A0A4P9X4V0_9FUNG|nr:hypothetical protein CXG81DRAFT_19909 [Caulochytrium protostelioides]|eukprot:RKP00081.1 hypothetical protein CXG81DRAFT_19909 [Caulochytrium protostelioides]
MAVRQSVGAALPPAIEIDDDVPLSRIAGTSDHGESLHHHDPASAGSSLHDGWKTTDAARRPRATSSVDSRSVAESLGGGLGSDRRVSCVAPAPAAPGAMPNRSALVTPSSTPSPPPPAPAGAALSPDQRSLASSTLSRRSMPPAPSMAAGAGMLHATPAPHDSPGSGFRLQTPPNHPPNMRYLSTGGMQRHTMFPGAGPASGLGMGGAMGGGMGMGGGRASGSLTFSSVPSTPLTPDGDSIVSSVLYRLQPWMQDVNSQLGDMQAALVRMERMLLKMQPGFLPPSIPTRDVRSTFVAGPYGSPHQNAIPAFPSPPARPLVSTAPPPIKIGERTDRVPTDWTPTFSPTIAPKLSPGRPRHTMHGATLISAEKEGIALNTGLIKLASNMTQQQHVMHSGSISGNSSDAHSISSRGSMMHTPHGVNNNNGGAAGAAGRSLIDVINTSGHGKSRNILTCSACIGRGWRHNPLSPHLHMRDEHGHCAGCGYCQACQGSGMVVNKTTCQTCISLGFLHVDTHVAHTGPRTQRCAGCTVCRDCDGIGVLEKEDAAEGPSHHAHVDETAGDVREACDDCLGHGFSHTSKKQHKGPKDQRCRYCDECKTCSGAGVVFRRPEIDCVRCEGSGLIIHCDEHRTYSGSACDECIACRVCQGAGKCAMTRDQALASSNVPRGQAAALKLAPPPILPPPIARASLLAPGGVVPTGPSDAATSSDQDDTVSLAPIRRRPISVNDLHLASAAPSTPGGMARKAARGGEARSPSSSSLASSSRHRASSPALSRPGSGSIRAASPSVLINGGSPLKQSMSLSPVSPDSPESGRPLSMFVRRSSGPGSPDSARPLSMLVGRRAAAADAASLAPSSRGSGRAHRAGGPPAGDSDAGDSIVIHTSTTTPGTDLPALPAAPSTREDGSPAPEEDSPVLSDASPMGAAASEASYEMVTADELAREIMAHANANFDSGFEEGFQAAAAAVLQAVSAQVAGFPGDAFGLMGAGADDHEDAVSAGSVAPESYRISVTIPNAHALTAPQSLQVEHMAPESAEALPDGQRYGPASPSMRSPVFVAGLPQSVSMLELDEMAALQPGDSRSVFMAKTTRPTGATTPASAGLFGSPVSLNAHGNLYSPQMGSPHSPSATSRKERRETIWRISGRPTRIQF